MYALETIKKAINILNNYEGKVEFKVNSKSFISTRYGEIKLCYQLEITYYGKRVYLYDYVFPNKETEAFKDNIIEKIHEKALLNIINFGLKNMVETTEEYRVLELKNQKR